MRREKKTWDKSTYQIKTINIHWKFMCEMQRYVHYCWCLILRCICALLWTPKYFFFFSSRLYFPQNELSNVSNKISRRIWKFGSLCREIEKKKNVKLKRLIISSVKISERWMLVCARLRLIFFFPFICFFLSSSLSHSKIASCVHTAHRNGKKVRISGEREMKSNQSNTFAYNCL